MTERIPAEEATLTSMAESPAATVALSDGQRRQLAEQERIPDWPLDQGDHFEINVDTVSVPDTDTVLIDVPRGKGAVFAVWLHRKFTETPELRQARREADQLAELKAGQ